MPHLSVSLSQQLAPSPWNKTAPVSFTADGVQIHLGKGDQLRQIKKAARLLESLQPQGYQLVGEWHCEQQWAFAVAATSPKRTEHIFWCDNQDAQQLDKQYQALLFTRDLMHQTPEQLSPLSLAQQAADWLSGLGKDHVSSQIIQGEDLLDDGWIGIYEVGRGSNRPPTMLALDFNPTGNPDAPVKAALVGKGITFDSGGYSIKTSEGMLQMKFDMGGAATVTGALGLAIMQGLRHRVKLYLCCAENLVSGHAYKLGDILTYKNGLSVEIVNTDAEGRLVLADGLIAATESGAQYIIDAATLTGAAHVAVGNEYNALFSNSNDAQRHALAIAEQENEALWPLPLASLHQETCPSHYADTANSRAQKGGGAGGASNAAGFLSRFVAEGCQWLHFDLAGAMNANPTSTMPAGASGMGIRTIARLLLD